MASVGYIQAEPAPTVGATRAKKNGWKQWPRQPKQSSIIAVNTLYISVANNLSVDCDCDSSPEDPKMGDIGILASLDPVALDKACTDLVRSSEDHGKIHLIERIDSRKGMHTLEYAERLGLGSQKYELVRLD